MPVYFFLFSCFYYQVECELRYKLLHFFLFKFQFYHMKDVSLAKIQCVICTVRQNYLIASTNMLFIFLVFRVHLLSLFNLLFDKFCLLQRLDISGCQNISHVGLSKLTSISGGLEKLILADGSPVIPLPSLFIRVFWFFLFFIFELSG